MRGPRLKLLASTGDADLFHTPGGALTGGIASDSEGRIFFANGRNIGSIEPDGLVLPYQAYCPRMGSIDGPLDEACFTDVGLMAMDSRDTLYIADAGLVRKATPEFAVTTLADLHPQRGHDLRPLIEISGLDVDKAGNVYVAAIVFIYDGRADKYSVKDRSIKRIADDGGVTTIDILPQFENMKAIRIDEDENVYFIDGIRIMKRSADGKMHLLADLGSDSVPNDMAMDSKGSLYVSDLGQHAVLRIDHAGGIEKIAELAMPRTLTLVDPDGLAVVARGGIYEIEIA